MGPQVYTSWAVPPRLDEPQAHARVHALHPPVTLPPAPTRAPLVLVAVACLAIGAGAGFAAGVLAVKEGREVFASFFLTERRAAVDAPVTVERSAFRFQHAENWKIDVGASDYDADHNMMIFSPGHSFVMLQIAEGASDPHDFVEAHVNAQISKLMERATKTPFTKWGAYSGEGVLLEGKGLGITPVRVRIFSFRAGERTFTVVEWTTDEDRAKVEPGFALVERTFRAHAEEE